MMAPTVPRLRQIVTPILISIIAYATLEGVGRRAVKQTEPAELRRP
jgi:hypothetical protein